MPLSDNAINALAVEVVASHLSGVEFTAVYEHPACEDVDDDAALRAVHDRTRNLLDDLTEHLRGGDDHVYTSTACWHAGGSRTPLVVAKWLHNRCRLECKWCPARCRCCCHSGTESRPTPDSPATGHAEAIAGHPDALGPVALDPYAAHAARVAFEESDAATAERVRDALVAYLFTVASRSANLLGSYPGFTEIFDAVARAREEASR